jgi:hypothetical protein
MKRRHSERERGEQKKGERIPVIKENEIHLGAGNSSIHQ